MTSVEDAGVLAVDDYRRCGLWAKRAYSQLGNGTYQESDQCLLGLQA